MNLLFFLGWVVDLKHIIPVGFLQKTAEMHSFIHRDQVILCDSDWSFTFVYTLLSKSLVEIPSPKMGDSNG